LNVLVAVSALVLRYVFIYAILYLGYLRERQRDGEKKSKARYPRKVETRQQGKISTQNLLENKFMQ
jgi:hypothetical protein